MKHSQPYCALKLGWTLALGLFTPSFLQAQSPAPGPTIPEVFALPSASADSSKPGFVLRVSQVEANTGPNSLSNAEKQLAGGFGDNLADPTALGADAAGDPLALAAAQAPDPSTAPISFELEGVINLNRNGGESRGAFAPNLLMPGVPGTGGSKANIAGEILAYLDLPAGTTAIGVIASTFHRLQIGGITLGDQFGPVLGQIEDDNRRGGRIYNVTITKAGLYPARLIFENAGDDRTYVQWFTGGPDNKVLINDRGNPSTIRAYRAVTTPRNLAYARRLIPSNGQLNVQPNTSFHAELVDGASPVTSASVSAQLDGVAVTPKATLTKANGVNSVDFSTSSFLSPGSHTVTLNYTESGNSVTRSWSFMVGNYVTLDAAWRVTNADVSKPGFIWNVFANRDGANTANTVVRAEKDLTLAAVDSTGASLPNLADPTFQGAANGPAAPADPANAPLRFEIESTINLDANSNMPGGKSDGQAAEILTYLDLPAGVVTMVMSHDDAFSTAAGPNPMDAFGRVELASDTRATTTSFSFAVKQAGVYPFRTVWENGGGGSVINWYSQKADGSLVLINDVANGGIAAYRATTAPVPPIVRGTSPPPVPRQIDAVSSGITLVLQDGDVAVDDASVSFQLDGSTVLTTATRSGAYLILTTGPLSGFQAPGEAHQGALTFKDAKGTVRSQQWSIYNLENLVLPDKPVVIEDFESTPQPGSPSDPGVPDGWVATNYTHKESAAWDFTSQNNAPYENWVVISTDTVRGIEGEVLQNDTTQLINGAPIDNWISGNLMFAASDGRAGNGDPQYQVVITKGFDLSKASNPVLMFYSGQRISDNRSEADAVEYSVDGGKNWLPGAYYHFRTLSLNPDGSYDAVTMLNDPNNGHVPTWTVPGIPGVSGGTFGGGIGAPVSQALAPYIANRANEVQARRVEAIRLFQAGNQSDVRIRFSHIGSCGWEWGIDNVAIYDIPSSLNPGRPQITSITTSAGKVKVDWTGGGTLEFSSSAGTPSWTSTGNATGTFTEPQLSSGARFYRVQR